MNEKANEKQPNEIKPDPSRACFLTTATVEAQGLPDDCEPLQLARYLRDHEMKSKKELSAVDLYYEIAPEIVARCDKEEWAVFWRDHIRKITALVKLGEYDLAKDLYTFATASLVNKKITHYADVRMVDRVYSYGLHGVGQTWLPYWMRYGLLKTALFAGLSYQSVRLGILKRKHSQAIDM
ncbi:hypothetical protein SAMN05518865_111225 [Duganella sp. CF458]|uniref:hypothetical protein n=1 Tax=Duganella sp. CF458 TaxID=1884368 RepID=UPI0008E169A8|nr:hypothetical protein [Duganella sp. CF458]SFG39919.1 hypothetical protein SAMN05518865_111225 [Duganella sp. CF458]